MAVAEIKKLDLYLHKSVREEVLGVLQRVGCCEIIPRPADAPQDAPMTNERLQEIDGKISEIRFLLRFLEPHYVDPVSSLDRSLGEKPIFSMTELSRVAEKTNIEDFSAKMHAYEARLLAVRSEISQIDGKLLLLDKFQDFPYTMDLLSSGTERVCGLSGTLPTNNLQGWKNGIEAKLGKESEVFVSSFGEKDAEVWVTLLYAREREADAFDVSSKYSLSRVEIPNDLNLSPSEEVSALESRKVALKAEEASIMHIVRKEAESWVPVIRSLSDYFSSLRKRYEVLDDGIFTDQTLAFQSWIPSRSVDALKKGLLPYQKNIEIVLSDPEKEEIPPTLLQNANWSHPYETLTKLYGVPVYGELDPTSLMAPFFFIYFGMCLGDAGYALVMIAALTYFMRKYKRMPDSVRQFMRLIMGAAVSTLIYGALTGSWFGDLADSYEFLGFFRPIKNMFFVIDPMQKPMVILGISLAFGIVHLSFGLFISFYDCIRKKDYVAAFGDKGAWITMLAGILLLAGGASGALPGAFSTLGKWMAIVGAVVVFVYQGRGKSGIMAKFFSGVLALYGSTSYLGDVLSYSRLLALGLASAAVGVIINMLGNLSSDIPYVGWLIGIMVVLVGHTFGMAVNILGAFVHSLRLQYVEFFSKFYSGGGKFFAPLTYSSQYVDITEASAKK